MMRREEDGDQDQDADDEDYQSQPGWQGSEDEDAMSV